MPRPQSRKLESAFSAAESACSHFRGDEGNQARLAQLMTIWAAGYLEVVCRETLYYYAAKRSAPEVTRYVNDQLRRFRNPNMERITQLVGAFDKTKAADLRVWADGSVAYSVKASGGFATRSLTANCRM